MVQSSPVSSRFPVSSPLQFNTCPCFLHLLVVSTGKLEGPGKVVQGPQDSGMPSARDFPDLSFSWQPSKLLPAWILNAGQVLLRHVGKQTPQKA